MQPNIDLGVEERRIAIEAIATLVHIKSTLAELLLKPAGAPLEVVNLLYLRDDVTGRPMSKRMAAPLILNELEKRADCCGVIRAIIDRAANWTNFHLADNEFQARATVQKAREMMGTIDEMEAREARQRELAREEAAARFERDHFEARRKHNDLLLLMFDEMARHADPHQRGYLLQELLNRLFDLHGIHVVRSFQRNNGAEQIDGAFKIEGWQLKNNAPPDNAHLMVEAGYHYPVFVILVGGLALDVTEIDEGFECAACRVGQVLIAAVALAGGRQGGLR